jgi:hypothetical protein
MKLHLDLVPALFAVLLLAAPAHSVTIAFAPSKTSVSVGDPFVVDLVVSELAGEIVSAYDVDIRFDAAVVRADTVVASNALGDAGALEALLDAVIAPGRVDLAGVSLLSDAALLALQGSAAVTLASLGFTKIGDGTTSLDFLFDASNDLKGANAQILGVTPVSGLVVPEPGTAAVVGGGLLVLAAVGKRGAASPSRRTAVSRSS